MIKIHKVLGGAVIISALCLTLVGCHHSSLSVEITWPYDGMRVYATPIGVKGAVSDSSAKITINNTPVVVAENGYFVGSVDLVEGENIITVVATIEGQERVIKTITITYAPG